MVVFLLPHHVRGIDPDHDRQKEIARKQGMLRPETEPFTL